MTDHDPGTAENPDAANEEIAREEGATVLQYATYRHKREQDRLERERKKAEQDAIREAARRKLAPQLDDLEDFTEARLETMPVEPVKWLVIDLISVGVWLCSSHPKIGKSFLMTCLCRAVSTGTTFANYKPTVQGSVLYLDLEGTQRRAKIRQSKVRGSFNEGSVDFHNLFSFPSMDQNGIEVLVQAIERWQLKLIVIDIWARFRPMRGKAEDIYSYDYRSISPLLEVAAKHQITVILVHHNRKQSDLDWMAETSGSTGLTGAVDGTMSIRRARGEEVATLSIAGRDVDEQELAIKFNGGIWSILGDAKEFFSGEHRKAIHGILSLPVNRAGMMLKDLAEDVGISRELVCRVLKKMMHDGVVASPRRGFYLLINPLDAAF